MKDPKTYDLLSFAILFVGVYEGLLPFVAKFTAWEPFLAFPRHLPNPWWWIVSAAIVVATVALLGVVDAAKKRRFGKG